MEMHHVRRGAGEPLLINENNLAGVDAVASSMGARLALELARRGGVVVGGVVSLDPGGF